MYICVRVGYVYICVSAWAICSSTKPEHHLLLAPLHADCLLLLAIPSSTSTSTSSSCLQAAGHLDSMQRIPNAALPPPPTHPNTPEGRAYTAGARVVAIEVGALTRVARAHAAAAARVAAARAKGRAIEAGALVEVAALVAVARARCAARTVPAALPPFSDTPSFALALARLLALALSLSLACWLALALSLSRFFSLSLSLSCRVSGIVGVLVM